MPLIERIVSIDQEMVVFRGCRFARLCPYKVEKAHEVACIRLYARIRICISLDIYLKIYLFGIWISIEVFTTFWHTYDSQSRTSVKRITMSKITCNNDVCINFVLIQTLWLTMYKVYLFIGFHILVFIYHDRVANQTRQMR